MRMLKEKGLLLYRKYKALKWWRNFKKERAGWVEDTIRECGDNKEWEQEIAYLKKYGADYFPYPWSANKHIIRVGGGGWLDGSDNKPYVIHNGKKLYMELRAYSQLLLEQNKHSPHRYFTDKFSVRKGDVFVDLGAAEGMISLDVVETASKVILVECEPEWQKRLEKTFQPWKDKTVIIPKYASDHDDDKNVSLNALLEKENSPIFIKMDVEGMEELILSGAGKILERPDTRVAICTYHKPGDPEKFKNYFEKLGYNIEFSEGYMAMVNSDEGPRFRKAMMRAWKE